MDAPAPDPVPTPARHAARPPPFALAAIVVLLLVLACLAARGVAARLDRFTIERATAYRSSVDGAPYRVQEAHGRAQAAADLLARINARAITLLRHLRATYARDAARAAAFPGRAAATRRLLARYSPDSLAENSPRNPEGDTSYTVDKGSLVALCLRRGGVAQGELHDIDLLMFVMIHEMSHIAVEAIDHPPEFWSAFKFLLGEAAAAGVYRPVDYRRAPVTYCGGRMEVNYSPLFDPATPTLK